MREFQTITELAHELSQGELKIHVFADGQDVSFRKLKTSEVKAEHGSIENYLNQIIERHSPKRLAVNYGKSNGTSWKEPKMAMVSFQKTQGLNFPQTTDLIGLNGMAQPQDNVAELRSKNWMLKTRYDDIKAENTDLKAENRILKSDKEQLERENRQKMHQIEDLGRKHEREIEDLQKPDFIEKLLENEDVRDMAMKLLDQRANKGLNAPNLDHNGHAVIEAMQKSPKLAEIFVSLMPKLQDLNFVNNLKKLMQPEGAAKLSV